MTNQAVNVPPIASLHAVGSAEAIRRWFVPPTMRVIDVDFVPREGAISHQHRGRRGSSDIVSGEFRLVRPSELSVYTWSVEGSEQPETLVRVCI